MRCRIATFRAGQVREDLLRDLPEPGHGQLVPRLVAEARDMACVGVVAHGPHEDARSAGAGIGHEREGLVDGQRIGRDAHQEPIGHGLILRTVVRWLA